MHAWHPYNCSVYGDVHGKSCLAITESMTLQALSLLSTTSRSTFPGNERLNEQRVLDLTPLRMEAMAHLWRHESQELTGCLPWYGATQPGPGRNNILNATTFLDSNHGPWIRGSRRPEPEKGPLIVLP